VSGLLYLIAIPSAFWSRWVACGIYVTVAIIWLVPDRRIESRINPLQTKKSLQQQACAD